MRKKQLDKQISRMAAILGRRGGRAKVPKGFSKMAPAQRSAVARMGALEKWRRLREAEKKSEKSS
jgi:hypothetical protein